MRRLWAVMVLFMLLTCASLAEGAEPGGYVGMSVGEAHLQTQYSADGVTAAINNNERAYKVFAGARFGLLGLEGGYVDFGTRKLNVGGTAVKVHASGFDAFGTLNLAVGRTNFFAKAGALNWSADATVNGLSADQSGTTGAYGAGASLRLTEHITLRGEYEKFDAPKYDDLHLWSAGIELTF